jgi:hypothetical protein
MILPSTEVDSTNLKATILPRLSEVLNPNRKLPANKKLILVFETDLAGTHRTPSAKTATKYYNAIRHRASGIQGRSYAIPIYNYDGYTPLQIAEIKGFIEQFISYAEVNPELLFKIAPLGQMSNQFSMIRNLTNCLKECSDNCYIDPKVYDLLKSLKTVH